MQTIFQSKADNQLTDDALAQTAIAASYCCCDRNTRLTPRSLGQIVFNLYMPKGCVYQCLWAFSFFVGVVKEFRNNPAALIAHEYSGVRNAVDKGIVFGNQRI